MLKMFYSFYSIYFIGFNVMVLIGTPMRLDGRPWNILVRRERVKIITYCVVTIWSWKAYENPFTRFFHNITSTHGFREYKKQSRIQRVNRKIPKIFHIVTCPMPDLSLENHENLFIRFSVMFW